MTSGMTRQGLANRIRRLERRLGWRDTPDGGQAPWPTWTYEQHLTLFGPFDSSDQARCSPISVLKDARLVRWLRQVDPERLRELKQAHAAREPVPPLQRTSALETQFEARMADPMDDPSRSPSD